MTKMLKGTEKALRASIKHWEVDGPNARKDGFMMSGSSCALCKRFYGDHTVDCGRVGAKGLVVERCPVYNETGQTECDGTPWRCFPTPEQAKAMVKFLKRLLP